MGGYLGPRTMIVFVGMLVVGLALAAARMASENRTLQGSGTLLAMVGFVFTVYLIPLALVSKRGLTNDGSALSQLT